MISKIAIFKRYFKVIFDLKSTQENEEDTFCEIKEGVVFKGKNLWLLAIAIIISCVGLNINSKSAVIGAMIISPLMGPVFGIAFSLGISDIYLLKLSFKNIFRIIIISVFFSTLYYLIAPFSVATPELLSFSKPTIFDVLLAFCGGIAGMIAISRQNGTQVLIGVAIATSCIPPLCTAGFGFATLQWQYALGGIYTYIINAYFICLGAFIITKFLKFTSCSKTKVKYIKVWFSVIGILTLIPACILAFQFSKETLFNNRVETFIENEIKPKFHVSDYLILNKNNTIELDILVEKFNDTLEIYFNKKWVYIYKNNCKIKLYQTIEAKNQILLEQKMDSVLLEFEKLKK